MELSYMSFRTKSFAYYNTEIQFSKSYYAEYQTANKDSSICMLWN